MSLTRGEREELNKLRDEMAGVREGYAKLWAMFSAWQHRLDGHHKTLYGTEGNGGVNNEVLTLTNKLASHMEREGKAIADQGLMLVGADGKSGMAEDVRQLKADHARQERTRKLTWTLAVIIFTEAITALMFWLFSLL